MLIALLRCAGGHVADDWDGDRVAALVVGVLVTHELDGAGLAGVALDQATPLQLVEMVVDGRAGAQADRFADLADARGIVAGLGHIADVVQDLGLPFGQLISQFVFFLQRVVGTLCRC